MNSTSEIFYTLIDKEKNIYELATLYPQNRKDINEYIDLLQDPKTCEFLEIIENKLVSTKNEYKIIDNIASFSTINDNSKEWNILNKQFLNYHKSLNTYELINSMPIVNYLSLKTKIGFLKNIKVLDVGGGTGHTFCSFFQYPETIEYYLLDPNIRLIHDQFIRIFPKLTYLKMGHIQANAENLPIKNSSFDLILSLASIDHLNNYKKFISEAYRVLKPNGIFFVSSHLEQLKSKNNKTSLIAKVFSFSFFERFTRHLYARKFKIGSDDHTLHLKDEIPIENELLNNFFIIENKEVFKRNFYFVAKKRTL